MSRRLLGPVGGPITFFLFAALVFAGLGWLTVVALRVEQAQREAAARAELGNNLRVALWRLDGRMLPALGVEDSRPFYHYTSADPATGSTAGPTPLLAAPLPDWMKLHVQLDPVAGWESPQVLAPDARDRVADAWPDLPLRNTTADRAAVLAAMKGRYPVAGTCELLAARERATPADDRAFAAPLIDPQSPAVSPVAPVALVPLIDSTPKPPPLPDAGRTPPLDRASDGFRLFGWELSRRDAVASNLRYKDAQSGPKAEAAQPVPAVPAPPSKPAAFPPGAPPVGGAVGRAGFPPLTENERQMLEYRNRTGTISRGVQEAKNAGLDFPMPNFNKGQGQYQNSLGNGLNQLPVQGPAAGDKAKKDEAAKEKAGEALQAGPPRGTLSEHLAALILGLDHRRDVDALQQKADDNRKRAPGADDRSPAVAAAWAVVVAATGNPAAPRPVPPAEERPLPNLQKATNNFALNNSLVGPPAVNIHLGSMRPQWITAADGTETLVLVRVAKIDSRTVYQGVILDWAKLEQVLKDEVKDLFPDAALVPVRDAAGVAPDRAMTALPVQLDPGPTAALPPAGWTPLRFGLVLAWVAALVAFAAVGLSGWSLVDLAERRIRFVSAVTHELRTPLTSLRLYIDLLMTGMIQDEAKRQEYLNTLATESDRLHRLIDNVLDFAKLEKRRANGDMKPVKVGELLDQLRTTWTDRVGTDGKELVVISTLPADTEVRTDAVMVHQIVGNLIDNARKYTREAADTRIWLWAKPGGSGRVVFEVEDRGPGVPAGERKSIFKPFRRGAKAETTAGGAGLGLALAKQWAEVLGGTVAYRPADGAPGACFRLELPVK